MICVYLNASGMESQRRYIMVVLSGLGIGEHVAFGILRLSKNNCEDLPKYAVENTKSEKNRAEKAMRAVAAECSNLYEKMMHRKNVEEAGIFEVHKLMLQDEEFQNFIFGIIEKEKVNAEYSIFKASEEFAGRFLKMDDEYMRQRASDVKDVCESMVKWLLGKNCDNKPEDQAIIFGDDLMPSTVSKIDKKLVNGCILINGSENSHTSIIARVRDIPMIIGIGDGLKKEYDGMDVAIDTGEGKVYISPNTDTIKLLREKKIAYERKQKSLNNLKGKNNITIDGYKVNIYANINDIEQIDEVVESDAGGIGLFRSEFLYLSKDTPPSEEEQFEVYKNIAQKMNGSKVIIRTIDIGSDKNVDYLEFAKEANPALGCRGIRVCLDKQDLFFKHLKAIYRASAYGNISVMFPMITSVKEVRAIKKIINSVKDCLLKENIAFSKNVEIGVMIETPAAVVISDLLAEEVDFFSIGTNDLTQYTLAADRQNSKMKSVIDEGTLPVLRMIKMVVDNAHKNKKWVGICGEMASNPSFTSVFLKMGVDELSMPTSLILPIRKKVTETNLGSEENLDEYLKLRR